MNEQVLEALNKQINEELFSAYLYLAMSAYFADQNLNGFAHWMKLQSHEELEHAMKMFDYLNDRGCKPVMKAINVPTIDWESPLKAFEDAYQHEQHITASIHKIFELAASLKDYATQNFLQWFIAEQVEEESTADDILQKLKIIDNQTGLLFLDNQLGKRGGE